ncbi:hypothetical protein GYH30_035042 [Glycine max]|uniref:Thioredoxin domain-containing protein n=2 Tax=Glycine subgen. Soja TaxID=1462606 RepID=A0A0R0GST5_SOYBN|nr:hypothetical protein GYH30_035042 [Glycine max]RZB70766.1 Thioredoxin M-type, chloroplastic [Glycine soja]
MLGAPAIILGAPSNTLQAGRTLSLQPVIDELAKEYSGKIACFKLNTDDYPNIATEYGIRSISTVLFFKNGEKKESVVGAVPKSTLSATVEKYVDV